MKTSALIPCFVGLTMSLQAATTIPVSTSGVTTHDNRNNFGGDYTDMVTGSGMNPYSSTSDPSTWRAESSAYGDEWQSQALLSGASNGKIGWATFDLGSVTANLESLYLWNVREASAPGRQVEDFNVYYVTTPVAAPPTGTNGDDDYNFATNGWTLLNTGGALTLPTRGASPDPANLVVDLEGVAARYIGIEILSNRGDASRVGLAEVGITQIPEPTAALLGGIGALLLLRRRK